MCTEWYTGDDDDQWSDFLHLVVFLVLLLPPLRHSLINWEGCLHFSLCLLGARAAGECVNKYTEKTERERGTNKWRWMSAWWENAAWVCSGGQRKGERKYRSVVCYLSLCMCWENDAPSAATGDTTSTSKMYNLLHKVPYTRHHQSSEIHISRLTAWFR